MKSPARRPRLAVIVANGITGDSRVQKTAVAAARDGWDVTLIGRSDTKRVQRSRMGPIDVVRVPVTTEYVRSVKARRNQSLRGSLTQFRIQDQAALSHYRASYRAWVRQTSAETTWSGAPRRASLKAVLRARRAVYKLRVRAFKWEQRRSPKEPEPVRDWRLDWPQLVDLDLAFGPVIEELKPDVIHANDSTMIVTAARSAARLRASGHRCVWLYDAHEYVRGVEWPNARQAYALPAAEAEFIGRADAVVTVSPQLAELLKNDHDLPELPLVVGNSPVREVIGSGSVRQSVREVCGLGPEVPLMVYSGWLGPERGVDAVIDGLPELPGVHLALVCSRVTPLLEQLLATAETLGVRDRIHLVPYVSPHEVADYLSSADLGLTPFRRVPNCEVSLPTKVSEYLQARLPLVTSDVRVIKAYVEEKGLGEVFTWDDPTTFVAAASRALKRRSELAEAITEDVLKELSWEQQSAGLLELYRTLSKKTPPVPVAEIPWTVQETPGAARIGSSSGKPGVPVWTSLGSTPVKLGIGPANYAGQGAAFAQAVSQANPDVSVEVVMNQRADTFDYPADVYVDASRLGELDIQLEQVKRIVGRYSHLIVDAFMPVFGRLNGETIAGDLAALRKARVKVALLSHGSDIRHPDRHLERHEYSLFRDAPEGIAEKLRAKAETNRRIADESGLPLFVTTPDLLDDLPAAKWAPLVVDVASWVSEAPVMERKRPIVLHAPSKRWTKGTDRIMPVLTELHDSGLIDFRLAEDIPWAEMQALVKESDLVLDQFTTGSYGTFAVEAMAAGKPVIGYISDAVKATTNGELPVVGATPATLRDVLDSLIEDREGTAAIGRASVEFARTYHDGRWTAQVLSGFLK
ncbi:MULTISPECIES: glycosyltransferase family 4 protein [unclassified Streptomyces]|uniref:D-inositol 3-phosphate glycosyltransferase n=1 Tax=Streptomyces sp. gb1(2016) TaxID=1828321 RepID=A0A652KKZ0_9ACTN|nr:MULTISPECIES: glycosyltransferase [unclassified Streptomyces]TXS24302.1 glycosyltransferase [Streptomyces sp. gb1(2016)]WSS61802.1 glycosyltransferase [Streptomyces sp. NBC_01177]WSS68849.1 glycosyltransferase [Streptomyces sp. NBC_01175]